MDISFNLVRFECSLNMIIPILLPIQIHVNNTPTFLSKLSQVIVNSSAICIIISVIIVTSNLIDYFINGYNNEPSAVVLIHVFCAVFVVFALLCIAGAMKQILACLKIGFVMWVLLVVIWLTTCCVQFTSWYNVRDMCINNRCAESLWLSNFFYLSFEEVELKNSTKPAKNNSTSPETNTSQNTTTNKPPDKKKIPLKRNYLYLTLQLLVFISFLVFFIFLGSMVYSYHDALCFCYLSENEENQLVTVPNGGTILVYQLRR